MNTMPFDFTGYIWGPPLFAISLGVVLALWFWSRWRSQGAAGGGRQALEVRRLAVMDELRQLATERQDMDSDEYRLRRDERVAEAARLLRAMDDLPDQRSARSTTLLVPMAVGGVAVVSILLAWQAQRRVVSAAEVELAAQQRQEQPMNPHQMARQLASEAPEHDLPTLNRMAHHALLNGDLPTAMQLIEQARTLDPDDPEVQVHVNALRLGVGMLDRAEPGLEQVLQQHPDMVKAHLWMGVLRLQQGDMAAAQEHFKQVTDAEPHGESAAFLRSMMADMQAAHGGMGAMGAVE